MPETEAETEATLATAETAIETKRTAKAVARKKVIIWGSWVSALSMDAL